MAEGSPPDPPGALLERLAHDLRGPLSPIQTATWLLRQGGLEDARRAELLDIIDRQTDRLGGMIQEISDWVRVHDGRLVGRPESAPVALLLDLVAGTAEQLPAWECEAVPEDSSVHVDLQRMVQMLGTLVAFLQAHGGVGSLRASCVPGTLLLALEAAGPWEEGEQGLVFAAPHPAPHDSGLGMGLLVAKEVVRAHGGDVQARESEDGRARLEVSLPLVSG